MGHESVKKIASLDVPYFRTGEFSDVMIRNEQMIKKFANANDQSRVVVMTGSGTLGMETVMVNTTKKDQDRLLIINGGSFGQRFCDIAQTYGFHYDELKLEFGQNLTSQDLDQIDFSKYTALYVNADETSSGVLYDLKMLGDRCHANGLFFVVDAISSFLADHINMEESFIDVLIIGSQKALALHPGVSILVLSNRALTKVSENQNPVFYMSLAMALKDAERGQTPFTPAVSVILQLEERLKMIDGQGFENEILRVSQLAQYFRERVKEYNFEFVTHGMSNAVTALKMPQEKSAKELFRILKDEYDIWICPNGGKYADQVFRVGHIGNLTVQDYDRLFQAFSNLKERGVL